MNAAKLGKCVKFELLDMAKGIAVFFGVMALVYAGNLVLTIGIFGGKAEDGFLSSVEFCSVIFLFVSGIVMFGQYFRLFLQCGMGRGLLSGSLMLSVPVLALIVTVLNGVLCKVMDGVYGLLGGEYFSLWEMLFPEAGAVTLLASQWAMLLAVTLFGLLISAVFQLVPKKARPVYCAAVPIGLLLLLFKGIGTDESGWIVHLSYWAVESAGNATLLFLGVAVVLGALVCGVSRKIWLQ